MLFEFDSIDESNLNRVLHSLRKDVVERTVKKTARAQEVVGETGLPTNVVIVEGGDVRDASVADQLRGCDFRFGCVDREWPRLILSEVAYQYLVPLIDMGTEVGLAPDGTELQSLDARVSYVVPAVFACHVWQVYASEGLCLEGLSEDELERTDRIGILQGHSAKSACRHGPQHASAASNFQCCCFDTCF